MKRKKGDPATCRALTGDYGMKGVRLLKWSASFPPPELKFPT